ncbi:MAG: hypothetical protein GWM98_27505 [Nitrospinaceae bacterium]|nr:hypothetical protein [Nitrospinaceae bacterium]NIR57520.1 hypothetical protein [Nitrospinaceae bacterium]NIS87990.1 hypothetical protein [Nitrospinaceae bacterium]NIT84854.1 hypothetical protein [Nitrospinaceae bacterium]NIU47035.1 hypothetical protein [Nitrospinaceae bacterium]
MFKKLIWILTVVLVMGFLAASGAFAGDANLDGRVGADDFGATRLGGTNKTKKEGGQNITTHKRPRTKAKKDMPLKGSKILSNNKIQPKGLKGAQGKPGKIKSLRKMDTTPFSNTKKDLFDGDEDISNSPGTP